MARTRYAARHPASREQKATALLASVIAQGVVVHLVGSRNKGTVGPYHKAVGAPGYALIVDGTRGGFDKGGLWEYPHAAGAAEHAVIKFGVGNVITALKAAAKKHGGAYVNLETPIVVRSRSNGARRSNGLRAAESWMSPNRTARNPAGRSEAEVAYAAGWADRSKGAPFRAADFGANARHYADGFEARRQAFPETMSLYKRNPRKPEYQFFVVVDGKVASGWSYRADANDAAKEWPRGVAKVYARKALERMGFTRLPTGNHTRNPRRKLVQLATRKKGRTLKPRGVRGHSLTQHIAGYRDTGRNALLVERGDAKRIPGFRGIVPRDFEVGVDGKSRARGGAKKRRARAAEQHAAWRARHPDLGAEKARRQREKEARDPDFTAYWDSARDDYDSRHGERRNPRRRNSYDDATAALAGHSIRFSITKKITSGTLKGMTIDDVVKSGSAHDFEAWQRNVGRTIRAVAGGNYKVLAVKYLGTIPKRRNSMRTAPRRRNHHLRVGEVVTYRGRLVYVTATHAGDHYTVRTDEGAAITVPGAQLKQRGRR